MTLSMTVIRVAIVTHIIAIRATSPQTFDYDDLEYDPFWSTTTTTTKAPFIDPETPKNVTVIKGKTATLACVVRDLGTASVSWMRIKDLNVLSLNEITNTKDPRIKETTVDDNGQYECQVSTRNKIIAIITLNVLDPRTSIVGPKEVYVSKGSTLNLTCVIQNGPEVQPFIIWTHNSKMLQFISATSHDPSILRQDASGHIVTQIVVGEASAGHSGTYRCEPGEAPADEVVVHVIDGKLPAGLQRAGSCLKISSILATIVFVVRIFVLH